VSLVVLQSLSWVFRGWRSLPLVSLSLVLLGASDLAAISDDRLRIFSTIATTRRKNNEEEQVRTRDGAAYLHRGCPLATLSIYYSATNNPFVLFLLRWIAPPHHTHRHMYPSSVLVTLLRKEESAGPRGQTGGKIRGNPSRCPTAGTKLQFFQFFQFFLFFLIFSIFRFLQF
jgi:hypothetical protein